MNHTNKSRPGLFIIISSPSGGGKDTIINALLKRFPNSARFLTTTSRLPRPDDRGKTYYHFISESEFKNKIAADEFVEYNYYAGNYYGSERELLEETLAAHPLVFSKLDTNGKHNLDKQHIPHLAIFLLPDNLDVLRHRIERRGGVNPEKIEERLCIAAQEIEESKDYDYRLINHDGHFDETVEKIAKIIEKQLEKATSIDKIT